MSRRRDSRTAELVDMALLTRAAFTRHAALQYARIAGMSVRLTWAVLSRPLSQIRNAGMGGYGILDCDRRHGIRP